MAVFRPSAKQIRSAARSAVRIAGKAVFFMLQRIRSVIRDKRGIAPLEYALIAGLIFSALLNASLSLSPKLKSAYSNIGTTLTKHATGT
ncbi:MAG: Flp family type IVb pilin [Aliidongia sp.]